MLKKILIISFVFLLFAGNTYAQEKFSSQVNVEYKVKPDGKTAVTHTITLINRSSSEFAKSYLLRLSNLKPENVKAYEEGSPVPVETTSDNGVYNLNVNFVNAVAGKGKSRTFIVTYEETSLVKQSGEVWEVTVPKLGNVADYQKYKVALSIPTSFGEEALVSPEPVERKLTDSRTTYHFDGLDLEKSGINAVFGKYQAFSFKLNYHLKNPEGKKSTQEIALPPDTSTQRVFYENITPKPSNVTVDEDGNWLATYEIPPKKNLDIKAEGFVQVFAQPVKFLTPYPDTLLENLKPQKYWQTDDAQIKEIADTLKTPRDIYKFVTTTLKYDYERVTPEVQRLGAKETLLNSNNAICMEFTDLFITLARAAGIPAREINGFAYSENPQIQPLSLVADVLHAWPEYWDEEEAKWIPVDPTWEATSKIDYFDKFDLKHIAFVIHGINSEEPLPAGSYKLGSDSQKDVFVELSSLPSEKSGKIEIEGNFKNSLNFLKRQLLVKVKNTGYSAFYDISPKLKYFDRETLIANIRVLPPYSVFQTEVEIPFGLFAKDAPASLIIKAQHSEKEIFIDKSSYVLRHLLIGLSVLLGTLVYLVIKFKKNATKT